MAVFMFTWPSPHVHVCLQVTLDLGLTLVTSSYLTHLFKGPAQIQQRGTLVAVCWDTGGWDTNA